MPPVPSAAQPKRKLSLRGAPPEVVDRVLMGISGAIWLAFVAMLVVAIAALVSAGDDPSDAPSEPSWGIYAAIGVSLVVIAGAIPLLLRARKSAAAVKTKPGAAKAVNAKGAKSSAPKKPRVPVMPDAPSPAEASTEKLRTFGALADPVSKSAPIPADYSGPGSPAYRAAVAATQRSAAVDRVWMRGTTILVGGIGLALLSVATGTYLLATEEGTGATVAFVFAGVVTLGLGAVPWYFGKRLRGLSGGGEKPVPPKPDPAKPASTQQVPPK